jgi:hypothetical protein
MLTPTEHKVRPSSAVGSNIGANTWTKSTPGTRSRNEVVKKPGSNFVYVILALAVLIGAYFIYASERPLAPVATKTEINPPVIVPTPNVPAPSTTVTPSVVTPATPPAASTATPPATTTTP